MKMDIAKRKQNIRKRLALAKSKNGSLSEFNELSAHCSLCQGTGKYCTENLIDGNMVAELVACPDCNVENIIFITN
jgi:DnaJ-class molecular chaperone